PSRHPHDLHSFPTRRASDLISFANTRYPSLANAWATRVVPANPSRTDRAFVFCASARIWGNNLSFEPAYLIPCVLGESRILLSRSEEHTSELQSRENLVCRL